MLFVPLIEDSAQASFTTMNHGCVLTAELIVLLFSLGWVHTTLMWAHGFTYISDDGVCNYVRMVVSETHGTHSE